MNDWNVTIRDDSIIEIRHEQFGHYGFSPFDLSIEDRLKMIHALSMTKEDMLRAVFGDGDGKHGRYEP